VQERKRKREEKIEGEINKKYRQQCTHKDAFTNKNYPRARCECEIAASTAIQKATKPYEEADYLSDVSA
jgi:hypothetical protein